MKSQLDTIEAAIEDIKVGKMIVVVDDEDRENEGDLVMAADLVTPEAINFMAKEARGLICTPLAEEIANHFELFPMVTTNSEAQRTNFTVSVDYKHGTTTGISASDRAKTIKMLTDLKATAVDFNRPGHIFPLRSKNGGVLVRAGHTEAAIDLVKFAGLSPVGVICEIAKEDGEMARMPYLLEFAKKHALKIISIRELIHYRSCKEKFVQRQAETLLPTDFGNFRFIVYRNELDKKEHVALVYGTIDPKKPTLVRVHSECLTGEVFHSMKCDCREQLENGLQMIAKEGNGVFVYMRQEGRGIGLVNKIKAYSLQEKGYDTVEANTKLGFKADLREYGIGAQILVDLGVKEFRLMTNNPKKIIGLEGYGLKLVDRVSIEIPANKVNHDYMVTKKKRMGHMLKDV